MKKLIKLILLVLIVGFALINYRIFSFNKGFSKTDFGDKSIAESISTIANIKKIEYYKRTIPSEKATHKIYIETSEDAYLINATEDEIKALSALGSLSSKFNIEKISPIPFYVEIVVGFIVLIFPTGKKKSKA